MPQPSSILVDRRPKSGFDLAQALTRASRETGRSAPRIGIDPVRRMLGKQRLKLEDYFVQGAFRRDAEAPPALVDGVSNQRLNRSLIAEGADDRTQLMADKYLSGLVLQANGFPVPEPKAAAMAREVARLYQRGRLIQEQLRQPAEIEALIGPGIGTVRLVTLWEAAGPQVLYAVWRHPAPGTREDAAIHGKPNAGFALDGVVQVTAALGGGLSTGREVTRSLINPDLPLVGYRLPHWQRIVELGCSAHRLFPGHALIGWDIAITTRGPVISEVNSNPLHMSYQRSCRRGFQSPDLIARLDAARRPMQARCKPRKGKGGPGKA